MRNANGVTETGRQRGQFHADEAAVMFFTGMSKQELTDYKLDCGKEWLIKFMTTGKWFSEADAEELWKEPLLLQWWHLEWRKMDHHIILPMIHKVVEAEREAVYREFHEAIFLPEHPNHRVLVKGLEHVVGMMCKELVD